MKSRLIVLMAHFNNPEGLEKSLRTIDEPFKVDVLVVDDGSEQRPNEEQLQKIYTNGRLIFDYLETNLGVGVAANRALQLAQEMDYELIARLDCGDFNHKGKYQRQLEYLDNNPDVKLLGTWARVLDDKGNFKHMLKHPCAYEQIKKKMYFNSMFLNPSVVFYTEILKTVGNYPYKYRRAAQDYAFFFKVIRQYKAENLPEVLIDYIIEPHSISTTKRRLQVKNRISIVLDNFYFGWYPVLGLFRGMLLYLFPRKATTFIKKYTKRN
ncbi:glycosyltransferase [Constantimarinum furrinae]|nr:glycosyltransferase [Constantimarinum furrinae]